MPKPLSAEERLEWGAKICQQQKSGLSICRWCCENQVAIGSFHYWKRHLQPKKKLTRSSFTELSMDQDTGITLGQGTRIALEYQGIRILIDKYFDPATLQSCLTALQGIPC